MEELQRAANRCLRKRQFLGSGVLALNERAFGRQSTMNSMAQNILRGLLQQHDLQVEPLDIEERKLSVSDLRMRSPRAFREVAPGGKLDDEFLERARSGDFSLFLSIAAALESNPSQPIPSKSILRACCLSIRPGDVPGSLDSKDVVLAALHFLSSEHESSSRERLSLPLIQSTNENGDLEKRSWEKVDDWALEGIREKLLDLEEVFLKSSSTWEWLRRDLFSPRLPDGDEKSFFLKGAIPAVAARKKTSREQNRKRKVAAITSSPQVSHDAAKESDAEASL